MEKYELTQNKQGDYVVSVQREPGMVPILVTKRKEEAELMLSYVNNP